MNLKKKQLIANPLAPHLFLTLTLEKFLYMYLYNSDFVEVGR